MFLYYAQNHFMDSLLFLRPWRIFISNKYLWIPQITAIPAVSTLSLLLCLSFTTHSSTCHLESLVGQYPNKNQQRLSLTTASLTTTLFFKILFMLPNPTSMANFPPTPNMKFLSPQAVPQPSPFPYCTFARLHLHENL